MPRPSAPRPVFGLALSALSYVIFSAQDAIVKGLVAVYSVPQILLIRSLVILALAAALARRGGHPPVWESRNKPALLLRSGLMIAAWLLYYSAARDLPLGQLTTLYFVAPVFTVALAALFLREKVALLTLCCVALGFAGTFIAANGGAAAMGAPALMALFAALCWAGSTIVVRLVNQAESSVNLMLANAALFTAACTALAPWSWTPPDAQSLAIMAAMGVLSGLGQYLQLESLRHAPASTLAQMEYTALPWAFLLGFWFFAESPTLQVILGAALIVASTAALLWRESRGAGQVTPPSRPQPPRS